MKIISSHCVIKTVNRGLSVSLLVGRKCGLDPRSKNQSCQVIPPVSCNKNFTCHKKCLKFNGCDTEIVLILAKSACFTTPVKSRK